MKSLRLASEERVVAPAEMSEADQVLRYTNRVGKRRGERSRVRTRRPGLLRRRAFLGYEG